MKRIDRHQECIDLLIERLQFHERYTEIYMNVEYNRNGIIGEVDVLTYNSKTGVWHFYEVKSSHIRRQRKKAQTQFDKYKQAYPLRYVKGIFISPKKVYRLK